MKNKIQTLILDLGGVIFDLDYMATPQAFEKLGVKSFEKAFNKASQNAIFDQFDRGQVSESAFLDAIRQLSGLPLTDTEIESAWNAMLLGIPESRFQLLRQLRKHFNLYLLSNTNEIHIRNFSRELVKKYGQNPLEEIFNHCYFSSRMGMRKPDREIFEKVIQENKIDPASALFIDDSPQHVRGSILAGLPALHLELEKGDSLEKMTQRLFGDLLGEFD